MQQTGGVLLGAGIASSMDEGWAGVRSGLPGLGSVQIRLATLTGLITHTENLGAPVPDEITTGCY
jgi:hypothetical protein